MAFLTKAANRGSLATGYDIDNSLKFEADNSEYMKRVMTATGNRKTFTISVWLKRTELQAGAADGFGHTFFLGGNGGTGTAVHLRFKTGTPNSDALLFKINTGTDNVTNRVFRDTSAWYHIVLAVDTTQATDSNRLKLYVNGVQETSFATINYPTQNSDTQNNFSQSATYGQEIGAYNSAGTYYGKFCGYLAEYNHIDGQALAPTDFGEFDENSGIWKPKAYTGSFGTNGWYLDFVDAANLGDDSSGNSNNFTLTNITSADQATDTPTNNFTTWNVLPLYNSNIFSFPNGATEVDRTSGTGWTTAYSSLGANKGKWYAEFQILTSGNYLMNGNVPLAKIQSVYATQFYLGSEASAAAGAGYYSSGTTGNDAIYHDATFTGSGVTTSAGDIISVAMDCDNNKIHFAVNGTYTNSSNPATNTNGFNMTDDYQFFAHATLTGSQTWKNNFGGYTTISISSAASDANGYGTFEYAPPSGYYALCTKNLAEYG